MNLGETEVKSVAQTHKADVFMAQTSLVGADVAPGDFHCVPVKFRRGILAVPETPKVESHSGMAYTDFAGHSLSIKGTGPSPFEIGCQTLTA